MKPEKILYKFSQELLEKCKNFSKEYIISSKDELARRGQSNLMLITSQSILGKLGEELVYATYAPYFPNLSKPDYQIYDKRYKSWEPDLVDNLTGIKFEVKSKDRYYADKYRPSWTFAKNDRKIFGSKLDSQDLDTSQFICMTVIDTKLLCGRLLSCVNLQWLHDKNLFEELDHKELTTKLTVRFDSMIKVVKTQNELWQLNI
jgi:hypothetical protein